MTKSVHRHEKIICDLFLYPEIGSFSEKSDVVADVSADVAIAAGDITSGESREDATDKGAGKLSLRMKLVTPVEEGSSEPFSLQSKTSAAPSMVSMETYTPLSPSRSLVHFCPPEPTLPEEDESVVKVTTVSKSVTR